MREAVLSCIEPEMVLLSSWLAIYPLDHHHIFKQVRKADMADELKRHIVERMLADVKILEQTGNLQGELAGRLAQRGTMKLTLILWATQLQEQQRCVLTSSHYWSSQSPSRLTLSQLACQLQRTVQQLPPTRVLHLLLHPCPPRHR